MNLNTLLKKRDAIEAQIAAAQFATKRKEEVGDLAERAGVLDATDDEIMAALKPLANRRSATTGAKPVPAAPQS